MDLSHLLLEALNLMLVGMFFVGMFLGILVFLIPLLNKITPDERIDKKVNKATVTHKTNQSATDTPDSSIQVNTELLAVIATAIHTYKQPTYKQPSHKN